MDGKREIRSSARGTRWWVLAGAVYGFASFLPLTWELIREELWSGLYAFGGSVLVGAVASLLPAVWVLFLASLLPGTEIFSQTEESLYVAAPLAAVLGGAAGYLLKAVIDAVRRRIP